MLKGDYNDDGVLPEILSSLENLKISMDPFGGKGGQVARKKDAQAALFELRYV